MRRETRWDGDSVVVKSGRCRRWEERTWSVVWMAVQLLMHCEAFLRPSGKSRQLAWKGCGTHLMELHVVG